MSQDLSDDVETAGRIKALPTILEVICRTTGMGFAALARVTESRWIACGVRDDIDFGLKPGGELRVETTICNSIAQTLEAVVINNVSEDEAWRGHPTPQLYGFQSYISVPVLLADGSFFGTLCAIDPRPARLNTPEVIGMFQLFAELISKHLDVGARLLRTEENRRRWQNLLLQVPAGIALLRGPSHTFEWVNESYCRLFERSPGGLLGLPIAEALPEIARASYLEKLDQVYRRGDPFAGHESLIRLTRSSGKPEDVYVNFVYVPTKNDAGENDGIFAHFTDVTGMVTARKRVEESEQRFRQLADSMPQIVWTAGPDGQPDYHNARWYDFSGNDPDSDAVWHSILHPEDAEQVHRDWKTSVEHGHPFQIEARLRDYAKDCWRWFMCRAIAVRDSSGAVSRWFGTCTDIDEQKLSQNALLQAHKFESVGRLAGGVAHDFNNLLVGIMAGASFVLESTPPADPAYELLSGVVAASERAADLTRQLLAYAGKGAFFIEPVDLSEVITGTSHLMSSINKWVQIHLEPGRDLPAVDSDKAQLEQVLMNLVINATEAAGAENADVFVRSYAKEVRAGEAVRSLIGEPLGPGTYAVLEVEDTGPGMDPAILPKIFDPFFSTKFVGRGLGLAAVSGIVRTLKGGIEVKTEPGKGSIFRVLLPAGKGQTADPDSAELNSNASEQRTILLIDDEQIVRTTTRSVLEMAGYRVIAVDNGGQGLEAIREHPEISMVILDMGMPVMSGVHFMRELIRVRPGLPVLVSSGYSEGQVEARFAQFQIAGVLQKPYTSRELTSRVRQVLGEERVQSF
jgi:PAS domain S-box-containing protein